MKKNVFLLFLASFCVFQGHGFCAESRVDNYLLEATALIEESATVLGCNESCLHLAKHYYFDEKCYRKAMYWALKGAENGSSECMLLLRVAYGNGFGVIQDTEECLKWLVLAAAIGNEEAQKEVGTLERPNYELISLLPDADCRSLIKEHELQWKEVRKRAKAWVDSHPSLFLSKD